ncbi:Uncharacterised protein [Chlamydia trachomatis]|nr:Uncharacterised protein [Chlamydia trachomatis]
MKIAESKAMQAVRVFFGIFMILVYLGMAALMVINFFGWNTPPFTQLRWVLAVIFAIYGLYRGYRQFKGLDYYRLNSMEEESTPADEQ